jgi:trans-2,3-dihydro-3-hydroxyanthranilate isomerase
VYLFSTETHHPENHCAQDFSSLPAQCVKIQQQETQRHFLASTFLNINTSPAPNLSLRIEQGYEINRPSLVMLQARKVGGSPDVRVGGCVIPVAQGNLL